MPNCKAFGLQSVQLGQQRQRKRVAVGEAEYFLVLLPGEPPTTEVLTAFLRTEVAKRQYAQRRRPAGVGPPLHTRQLTARDSDQRLGWEARQVLLTQPAIERREAFVRVDKDRQVGCRSVAHLLAGRLDGSGEGLWRERCCPSIDADRAPTGLLCMTCPCLHEGGLPYSTLPREP
jgi:hypothetical protein